MGLSQEDTRALMAPEVMTLTGQGNTQEARMRLVALMQERSAEITVGNCGLDDELEMIREQFGDWTAAEEFEPPTPPEPEAERAYSVNFIQKSDVNQSTIYMGHPGEITRESDDYAPVTIMNEVLSGGFSGRLFQNVRSDQGLAYSVFGNYSAGYDRPGEFFAYTFTKNETTVEAVNAIMEEVERIAAGETVPIEANSKVNCEAGTVVGHAVQTRQFDSGRINPLYVSPGHRVSAETAADVVLRCRGGYKLPEPTRLADQYADDVKAGVT